MTKMQIVQIAATNIITMKTRSALVAKAVTQVVQTLMIIAIEIKKSLLAVF